MIYHVYAADLNSLYDEKGPNPPVFMEKFSSREEADKAVIKYQTHDTAAWVQIYEDERRTTAMKMNDYERQIYIRGLAAGALSMVVATVIGSIIVKTFFL